MTRFWNIIVGLLGQRPVRRHLGRPDCWCEPNLYQPCPECFEVEKPGPEREPTPGCWKCGGCGVVDPWNNWMPLVVVHQEKAQAQATPIGCAIGQLEIYNCPTEFCTGTLGPAWSAEIGAFYVCSVCSTDYAES